MKFSFAEYYKKNTNIFTMNDMELMLEDLIKEIGEEVIFTPKQRGVSYDTHQNEYFEGWNNGLKHAIHIIKLRKEKQTQTTPSQ